MIQWRMHPDPLRIDEQWKTGVMPDIRSKLTHFEDHPEVTFARVEVAHMDGLPLNHQLTDRGGRFLKRCRTAPGHRLFALPGVTILAWGVLIRLTG